MARAAHGIVTRGKKTIRLPWRVAHGSSEQLGPLRSILLRRTYADEVDRVAKDLAEVASRETVDMPSGPARRQLVADLATHSALLATIGEQLDLPGHLVAQARQASETADGGFA